MVVDICLNLRIDRRVCRYGTISGFIRIRIFTEAVSFSISLKPFDHVVAYFRLFSATKDSMPEESKMVIATLAESMAWQIGSVRSTSLSKMNCKLSRKFCSL